MEDFSKAVNRIQEFQTDNLGTRIADLESLFQGATAEKFNKLTSQISIDQELLNNAFEIKAIAGQINVIVHAVGMLMSLPYLLDEGEVVQSLSLGAGNTGKGFDLETNHRVAEFKFIQWQGGPESIRQNSVFKDFYNLAEHSTDKAKYLYVLRKEIPMKFFNGGRALSSVLSKNNRLWSEFQEKYGKKFKTVKDYYFTRKDSIHIVDLCSKVPYFAEYK